MMIVYNITIKIIHEIEKEWVLWQKKEHIPDVMASGQFTEYHFYRLLEPPDAEGISYIIQYFSSSLENYNRYIDKFASLLREKALSRWGNKFIAFRSVMEVVH